MQFIFLATTHLKTAHPNATTTTPFGRNKIYMMESLAKKLLRSNVK